MSLMAERGSLLQAERGSGLVVIPVISTAVFYLLPLELQARTAVQFLPQISAFACLALWARINRGIYRRLGLTHDKLVEGIRWGFPVGLTLGLCNSIVILRIVPWLGADIHFLQETPHARMPILAMVPWIIVLIAFAVELNFRGFLLGRLQVLSHDLGAPSALGNGVAVVGSALMFSFDPFMMATFQHLHWIAVWDGLAWGMIWIWIRNLYATIVAHAVEVIVLYMTLKMMFG